MFNKHIAVTLQIKISDDIPGSCIEHLNYAFVTGKNYDPQEDYPNMYNVTGISPQDATRNDFQRYFICKDKHVNDCIKKGLQFPKTCSAPPCDQCDLGNIIDKTWIFQSLYYVVQSVYQKYPFYRQKFEDRSNVNELF